ncbi:MAG: imidazole glycerol phosphate synthase subunit HisH [Terriglobia bacterium]
MIAVIDYGAGNTGSVLKAVEHLGFPSRSVSAPESLRTAGKIILPGQGHFGAMMKALCERRLLDPLREAFQSGKGFLGICLGLQALYEGSDEAPDVQGLGLLHGRVRKLEGVFKIPHVGWSQVEMRQPAKILEGIAPGSFAYFCHSYYGPVTAHTTAITEYGQEFSAAVELRNIHAVQFHPEKSADVGLQVLKNFLSC